MRKVAYLLISCSLFLSLVGCSKYKIVEVDDSTTQENTTEAVITATENTEAITEETISTEEIVNTEATTEAEIVGNAPVDYNFDYVGVSGMAFNCSEPLQTNADDEYYADYTWCREDGFFDITTEISSLTLEEEKSIAKDVYSDGEILMDEDTVSYGGYDAYVRIVKGSDYFTAIVLTEANSKVYTMKCVFDSEDGYTLAQEAIGSFTYVPR